MSQANLVLINTTKTTLGPSSLIQYLHGRHIHADFIYAPKHADMLYDVQEIALLINELRSYKIVGISCFTISEARAFQLAEKVKSVYPHIHVMLGGPNVIMDTERILRESKADSVCIHEGEIPLENFLANYGTPEATSVAGLWFKTSDSIIKNPYAQALQNLDVIPLENYKNSLWGSFKRLTPKGFVSETTIAEQIENPCMHGKFLYMMTTRGCPYSCTYCINETLNAISLQTNCSQVRRMSTVAIIHNLKEAVIESPDIEKIFFFDDDFSLRSEEDLEGFALSYSQEIGLPFYIFANPNTTSNKKLDLYAKAGIRSIEFGVQTVSYRVLEKYNRDQNAQHFQRIMQHVTMKDYDFEVSFDIITNSPFETTADVEENIRYVLSLPGKFQLYVHSLHLFPGSTLTRELGRGTGNELHEYQDNYSGHPTVFYNELQAKILFAMQGWHSPQDPDTYGCLTRRDILSMLDSPETEQGGVIKLLDEKMSSTRVANYYRELHKG